MENSIQTILNYNKPEFNIIKLAEELAELSEVVLKMYLKKEEHKPPKERLIEEMGDVLLRMRILAIQEKISFDVNTRLQNKTLQILHWIDEGKYKGGA